MFAEDYYNTRSYISEVGSGSMYSKNGQQYWTGCNVLQSSSAIQHLTLGSYTYHQGGTMTYSVAGGILGDGYQDYLGSIFGDGNPITGSTSNVQYFY